MKRRRRFGIIDKTTKQLASEDNLIASGDIYVDNRLCKIKGLLRPFYEGQSKSWLICPKLQFVVRGDKKGTMKAVKSICSIKEEVCNLLQNEEKPDGCVGNFVKPFPTCDFYIFCDADVDGKNHDFVFVQRKFLEGSSTYRREPSEKRFWLRNAHKGIESGRIRESEIPKPGSQIFFTLMRDEVRPRVTIYLFDRRKIEGRVLFHKKEPLEIAVEENDSGIVDYSIPLTNIGAIIVHEFDKSNRVLSTTLELLKKGHVVINHPREGVIYDFCKGESLKILKDGRTIGGSSADKHDEEVMHVARR